MTALLERPPAVTTPPVLPDVVEVDEAAARRTLRQQVARLERELAAAVSAGGVRARVATAGVNHRPRPRLLGLAQLEALRDDLAARVNAVRTEDSARATFEAANRRLLEDMYLHPEHHKWERLARDDVGTPGCGHYAVRPRLGPVGLLSGWWRVKLSSGCPLAMAYHQRRRPNPWGRNASLEFVVTVVVLVVVVATLAVFLLVFHDVPLRTS
jgi:hypothetical protein